jgi:hypothetical protein
MTPTNRVGAPVLMLAQLIEPPLERLENQEFEGNKEYCFLFF